MAEQKELCGTLSRNRNRENERQPEYRGSATIDGVHYWVSGWVKEGQDGKFFSLAFKAKDVAPSRKVLQSSQAPGSFDKQLDDEIPF